MSHRTFAAAFVLTFLAAVLCGVSARAAAPPSPVVPEGLGVNIHFTDPKPGEMKMLADGGFRIVRMDFVWGGTEREKGKYDFSAYDRLMTALEPHGIKALFILDYSNKNYDDGLSPCSDEGRKAFAAWAAAAAQHFKGRGILWEMYNEPNITFWKPKPKVEDYVLLALEVGKENCLAAWTTAKEPREVTLPGVAGRFTVTGHVGEVLPALAAQQGGLKITLTDAPQYLAHEAR